MSAELADARAERDDLAEAVRCAERELSDARQSMVLAEMRSTIAHSEAERMRAEYVAARERCDEIEESR